MGNLQLTSSAFSHGEEIPRKCGYKNGNETPPLAINGIPEGTKSLTLIMDDPDAMGAVGKVWVHWVVWNINTNQNEITDNSGSQGMTDFGEVGYGGPAPPDKRHTYVFKLYALNSKLELAVESTKANVEKAMEGHIIEQATLEGTYADVPSKKEEFEEYEKRYVKDYREKQWKEIDEELDRSKSNQFWDGFEKNKELWQEEQKKTKSFFEKINFNFKSELEAIVEIDYKNPMDVRERLFFGKQDNPKLYSRDYMQKSENNFICFKIEPTVAKNAKWSYDGNKEIGDNFENGYSLTIHFQHSEQTIRKLLIKLLQYYKFGSLPSSRTIHAHLDSKNPTELEAEEILNSVVNSFVGEDFSQ